MRAPVYRHIEGQSTVAGLGLTSFLALSGGAFLAIQVLDFASSMAVLLGAYVALRLMGSGRPPSYWQHLVVFHVRRVRDKGRVSAAERAATVQFPFGPYEYRDRARGH